MRAFSFEDDLDASLDMTPLIDAVFMLLIFFVMATTFSQPVLEVALAKADSAGIKEVAKEKLTVTITADGDILFDDIPVAPQDIQTRLEPVPTQTPLVFNVDKGAPFGKFVQVLDVAKRQQRSDFVINAGSRDGEKHDQPVTGK